MRDETVEHVPWQFAELVAVVAPLDPRIGRGLLHLVPGFLPYETGKPQPADLRSPGKLRKDDNFGMLMLPKILQIQFVLSIENWKAAWKSPKSALA